MKQIFKNPFDDDDDISESPKAIDVMERYNIHKENSNAVEPLESTKKGTLHHQEQGGKKKKNTASYGDYCTFIQSLNIKQHDLLKKIVFNGKFYPDFEPLLDIGYKKFGMSLRVQAFTTALRARIRELAPYNPVKEWANSLPIWDKQDHIGTLSSFLRTEDCRITSKRILEIALAGAYNRWLTGGQARVLVLRGKQGWGKSLFTRWLCPINNEVGCQEPLYTDEAIHLDKNDTIFTQSHKMVWEIGEMSKVITKYNSESMKAFITKESGSLRLPYEPSPVAFTCISFFIGTTNFEPLVAHDRRYIVLHLAKALDWEGYQSIDKKQLYAQVKENYKAWLVLSEEELEAIRQINIENIVENTEENILREYVIYEKDGFVSYKEIINILKEATKNVSDPAKIGSAMEKLGGTRYLKTVRVDKNKRTSIRGFKNISLIKTPITNDQTSSDSGLQEF